MYISQVRDCESRDFPLDCVLCVRVCLLSIIIQEAESYT